MLLWFRIGWISSTSTARYTWILHFIIVFLTFIVMHSDLLFDGLYHQLCSEFLKIRHVTALWFRLLFPQWVSSTWQLSSILYHLKYVSLLHSWLFYLLSLIYEHFLLTFTSGRVKIGNLLFISRFNFIFIFGNVFWIR